MKLINIILFVFIILAVLFVCYCIIDIMSLLHQNNLLRDDKITTNEYYVECNKHIIANEAYCLEQLNSIELDKWYKQHLIEKYNIKT